MDLDHRLVELAEARAAKAPPHLKAEAFSKATRFVDTLPFKGFPFTQALSWPRIGVNRQDGAPITGIPPELEQAVNLIACFILGGVPYDAPAIAWVRHILGDLLDESGGSLNRHPSWASDPFSETKNGPPPL